MFRIKPGSATGLLALYDFSPENIHIAPNGQVTVRLAIS